MSNKRRPGLSIEEKTQRVEQYLQERRAPFTLKELEAQLPKAKGVIFQAVLECLETLISEGRACSDKVGINVLYWCFDDAGAGGGGAGGGGGGGAGATGGGSCGGGSLAVRQQRADAAARRNAQLAAQLADLQAQVAASSGGEGGVADAAARRAELQAGSAELRGRRQRLAAQVRERVALLAVSPERLARMYAALRVLVNAWTDNVMLLQDHAVRAGGGCVANRAEFRRRFGMPTDFDYV